MKTLPEIGSRVKYNGPLAANLIGTVVKQFPGGDRCYDPEEMDYYISPHSVSIKVDCIPENWPYPGTDQFAPDISEIELLN